MRAVFLVLVLVCIGFGGFQFLLSRKSPERGAAQIEEVSPDRMADVRPSDPAQPKGQP